jgi:hypothetical protein
MNTRQLFSSLGFAAVLLAGQADRVSKDGTGVAIKGYDPVAYFTRSKNHTVGIGQHQCRRQNWPKLHK